MTRPRSKVPTEQMLLRLTPETATELKRRALERGVSYGKLVEDLLFPTVRLDTFNSPKELWDKYYQDLQKQMAERYVTKPELARALEAHGDITKMAHKVTA